MGILNSVRDFLTQPSIADTELYAQVAREIDSGHYRQGLWAKALAESDFDDNKARALYMRMAVKAIQAEKQDAKKNAFELFEQGRWEEALEGLFLLLEEKNLIAAVCLAAIYWFGETSEGKDHEFALRMIALAESSTDPRTRRLLGLVLRDIDWKRALANLDFAANAGDDEARSQAKELRKWAKNQGLLPKGFFGKLLG
jgi:hypothetical protein